MGKTGFLGYPEPLKGPDVPYKNGRKRNPPLRGFILVIAVFLMEWVRFVREKIWWNAGFGSLRKIRFLIQDYEPWFEPQVIKLPEPSEPEEREDTTEAVPDVRAKYPAAKYYSVADYHALYLSGELTPTQVARTLLPLIRRDTSPPGEHSVAWFDTKVDLVLKAAEASTQRYKEKRPLGPLDGVPTAVKDEYDVDGYMTCLGSVNDYTGEALAGDDGSITTWCARRLQDAGAVMLGKLSMHEFGLDTPGNNPIYGTPPNPFNKNYYTGGSSSGSAYAVSAGLIPIALGSDGGGSIRIPSSFCGIFGLKPTHGRLSFRPGQNHSITCAVYGPMAADIQSLAALYECIGTPHPSSPFPPIHPIRLSQSSASRARILGIPEAWVSRSTPAIQHICRTFVDRLVAEYGYRTVPIEIPFLVEGQTAHALTVLADAATLLPDTRNLTPANRIMLALGRVTPATDLILAQKLRGCLMQHLSYLWEQHPGMLIVTPTTSCAGWPVRSQAELKWGVNDGDRTIQTMEYAWMGNLCGLPGLSVPAGFVVPEGQPGAGGVAGLDVEGKIPVGLMAVGEWCAEEQLLQFGLDAEQVGAERRARPPIWVDVINRAKGEN